VYIHWQAKQYTGSTNFTWLVTLRHVTLSSPRIWNREESLCDKMFHTCRTAWRDMLITMRATRTTRHASRDATSGIWAYICMVNKKLGGCK